jgi:limonene-1,2-epoxide hydrolase
MVITWADDMVTINSCENKAEWTGYNFSNPDENSSGSSTPIYMEGSKCMMGVAGKTTAGAWYTNNSGGWDMSGKLLIWWVWFSGPTEIGYLNYVKIRYYDSTSRSGNWWSWTFPLSEIKGGWNALVVWPSQPDEKSATDPTLTAIKCLSIEIENSNADYDIKLIGWDFLHTMTYVQASGDTVTLDDIIDRDDDQYYGLFRTIGADYQFKGIIKLGAAGATTTMTQTLKSIQFRMCNSDHKIYFDFIDPTTGSNSFTLGALSGGNSVNGCFISYPASLTGANDPSDIFNNPGNCSTFKLYDTTIVNARTINLPTTSATREVLGCKFANCGEIIASTCQFEDNTIVNPDDRGLRMVANDEIKNCTIINAPDGLHVNAAGTYELDNIKFSGCTYDIENSSAGLATIQNVNGSNASTYENTGGGTTSIETFVSMSVNVKDSSLNNIQDAQVYIQKSSPTAFTADIGNNAGDGDLVVNEVVDTDIPQTGWCMVWVKSLNKIQPYRYASWSSKTFTFPTEVTGTCTTGGTSTQLIDSGANFGGTTNIKEGDTLRNTTDGSWAVVDEIVSATELKTTPLQDGTDNTWQLNDGYSAHKLATTLTDGDDTVDIPIMNKKTDSSGDVSKNYNYPGSPVNIDIRIRKNSSGGTRYIPYPTSGQITADGYSLTAILSADEVA